MSFRQAARVCSYPTISWPSDLDELQRIVAASRRARAIGTRHSFNDIADCDGTLISLGGMAGGVEVDQATRTAWVPAGMTYGALASALEPYDLALSNTGSLPHISVGGACAVGTHGSGDRNRVLSSSVSGLEIVVAGGELRTIDPGDRDFAGAVIALGGVGVVVRLRLDLVPAYEIRQDVYLHVGWDRLADLDDIFSAGYSVSVFLTSWSSLAADQVWVKRLADVGDSPAERWGAVRADRQTTPIGDPSDATQQGTAGLWADRLPHTRRERNFNAGAEIQSEYFVDRADAPQAIAALRRVASLIDPALIVSELRSVASDDLWLSPASGRDSIAIHFTWKLDRDGVIHAIRAVEDALEPFSARPHWGKWFAMDAARIESVTPGVHDFAEMCERSDPERVFRNRFLARIFHLAE